MKSNIYPHGYLPAAYPFLNLGFPVKPLRTLLVAALVFLSLSGFGQTTSFSFTSIPTSDPDLNAPGRGVEQWHDRNDVNVPNASTSTPRLDMYWRFSWNSFESAQGVYTWTALDNMINSAIDAGKKFSFGIMTVYPGPDAGAAGILNYGGANSAYPLYLHNLMQAESVKDWIGTFGDWVPNWNSPSYLARLNALHAAIYNHLNTTTYKGFKYKDVINYIDVRGFGSWGEWHSYGIAPTNDVSSYPAGTFPTIATFKAIIDAHVNNLPDIQLVMMLATLDGGYLGNTRVPAEIGVYALQARNARGPLGIRRDQWGATDEYIPMYMENNNRGFGSIPQMSTEIMARWKTAPILGEPPGWVPVSGGVDFGDLPRQVKLYHAVSFGNGNYGGTPSAQAGNMVREASKAAGYRLVLTGGNVNSTITPGTPFTINLNWQNVGLTPTYDNWNVVYELRNASNAAVWSGTSSFNLRLFLPATTATTATDNFTVPATVTSGSYRLVVVVRDPVGFRKPLPLAITGVNSDGSYTLATVNVGAGGSTSNTAPRANAGSAQTVTLPASTATLTGSGTDGDGSITGYAWSQVSGPNTATIQTPNAATTALSGLVAGSYTFRLTVTDNGGLTGTADVVVTVAAANRVPTVSAGNSQTVTLPANSATLTGTATDSDGTIATYAWTKVSGPTGGAISTPANASTTVTGLVAGTYTFRLTVTDNGGATASANVTVTVSATPNIAPTVTPGAAVTITLPTSTATVTGTAADVDGSIASYAWTQVSGPVTATIATPAAATTNLSGLTTAGSYVFKLTATDNSGASASGNVTVTVNSGANVAPTANAGSDITITLPVNSTTLSGSGRDSDGTISAYAWTKVSGPAGGTIASPKSAATNVTGLLAGTYVYRLTVTDDRGATATDNVNVIVNAAPTANLAPTANAGANQTITLPTNTATLSGTGTDTDGTIAAHAWSQVSGPSSATIANAASATTDVSNLVEGTYTFRLTVTDNGGLTATSDVQVTVNPAPANNAVNRVPVANAGADQTLTLPTNSASLNGSASKDPDGTISAYTWSQLSGPNAATIGSSASASTTVSNLVKGTYEFQLKVWDDDNATATAKVLVIVNDANQKAVIQLAADTVDVTLPTNNAELNASTSYDPDGTIAGYAWSYVSGPGTPGILAPTASKTTVNNLAAGTYVFNLAVTDNKGAVSTKEVVVVVSYSNNRIAAQALGVYPNPVQGMATISLNSDMEGKAVYQVTDLGGRPVMTGQFTKVSGAQTIKLDMSNLKAGIYFLKLQVNDVRMGVKKLMKL